MLEVPKGLTIATAEKPRMVNARIRIASIAILTSYDSIDRKSTRLNSSHGYISYAVFCLKKKKSVNSKALEELEHDMTTCNHDPTLLASSFFQFVQLKQTSYVLTVPSYSEDLFNTTCSHDS